MASQPAAGPSQGPNGLISSIHNLPKTPPPPTSLPPRPRGLTPPPIWPLGRGPQPATAALQQAREGRALRDEALNLLAKGLDALIGTAPARLKATAQDLIDSFTRFATAEISGPTPTPGPGKTYAQAVGGSTAGGPLSGPGPGPRPSRTTGRQPTNYANKPKQTQDLRLLNKEIQALLLQRAPEIKNCLTAEKVEVPTRWYQYSIPFCPLYFTSLDGSKLRKASSSPSLKRSRKASAYSASQAQPVCFPQGSASSLRELQQAVRPLLVNGKLVIPTYKELRGIRKVGGKASDDLLASQTCSLGSTQQAEARPGATSKRPRPLTPTQDSIVVADTASITGSSSSMDEDEAEDSEALPLTNRPIRPLPSSSRSQRVTQKPDYNVINAYTHLDLDSEQ
ncbi:hypothetical protein CFRS1_v011342 [Colletotrichum fructicola]|nr:hypothetical protein CFRS1_v000765 [Colletotrichum fructicola]KAF4426010.1 hypothetical protein CFRS1_v000178 [Colletotrichum fructicola]KAF4431765.1 hypothetical protein CFRS1_v011342 [Colletotrichum fructicola]